MGGIKRVVYAFILHYAERKATSLAEAYAFVEDWARKVYKVECVFKDYTAFENYRHRTAKKLKVSEDLKCEYELETPSLLENPVLSRGDTGMSVRVRDNDGRQNPRINEDDGVAAQEEIEMLRSLVQCVNKAMERRKSISLDDIRKACEENRKKSKKEFEQEMSSLANT